MARLIAVSSLEVRKAEPAPADPIPSPYLELVVDADPALAEIVKLALAAKMQGEDPTEPHIIERVIREGRAAHAAQQVAAA